MIALVCLLACHDRRAATTAALAALQRALAGREDWAVVLADDGCRDDTAAAARELLGDRLTVLTGDGSWYWNRGMAAAWREARHRFPGAATLWLNDDVVIDADAIVRLEATAAAGAIAIGSLRDPVSGLRTYGGVRIASPWRPLAYLPVEPGPAPVPCDTGNGNLVLVPAAVADRLGILDVRFHHGIGDFDYGLRARALGIPRLVAPGMLGACACNPEAGTWRDRSLGIRRRWRIIRSPKGLPPRQWFAYAWRHFGAYGLLTAAWTYVKLWLGR